MTPAPTVMPELRESLTNLLKIARAAQNTYVGRHWPDKAAMRQDGIGFWLNDGEHEDRIRRFLYECQPEFLVQYLEGALAALASAPAALDAPKRRMNVTRLRNEIAATAWACKRDRTAAVFECACDHDGTCWPHEEADAAIAAAYAAYAATAYDAASTPTPPTKPPATPSTP